MRAAKGAARGSAPVIGVTGGAGSGKSLVAGLFRERGARLVDADRMGHRLLRRGSSCYKKIEKTFGPGILKRTGAVDRGKLGALVFSEPGKMGRLNAIVHPELVRNIRRQISKLKRQGGGPIVLDAALIVDWGLQRELDALVAVEAPAKARLERLARKGVPRERARGIMASQLPSRKLRREADEVIVNTGTIYALRRRAAAAWERIAAKVAKPGVMG